MREAQTRTVYWQCHRIEHCRSFHLSSLPLSAVFLAESPPRRFLQRRRRRVLASWPTNAPRVLPL